MKILGFVAMKGSGKTTACKYLESKYGAVRVSFKDALIAELKEKFPELLNEILAIYSGHCLSDGETKEYFFKTVDDLFLWKPPLMRTLLQNYGTNVARAQDPDHWVLQWKLGVVEKLMQDYKLIVVDDVRFLNEAAAIKDWLGTLIRITRTDMVNTDTHQSEQEQKDIVCDYEIVCHGGDEDKLYAELDGIMQNK